MVCSSLSVNPTGSVFGQSLKMCTISNASIMVFTKAVNYYATTVSHTADKCIATINKDMKSSVNERGLINGRL